MSDLDLHLLLAVLGVVLAAVALTPSGAVVILAFLTGLLAGQRAD